MFSREHDQNFDPFFSDETRHQGYAVNQPARGELIDDLFGFRSMPFWKRRAASPPPARSAAYLGVAVNRRRFLTLGVALFLIFGGLAARAGELQISRAVGYRMLAEGNRIRSLTLTPDRGRIYDRNGALLVDNQPSLSISIIPIELGADESARRGALRAISEIIGSLEEDVKTFISTARGAAAHDSYEIKTGLTRDETVRLTLAQQKIPGILLSVHTRRFIAADASAESFGHLLGYLGRVQENELEELTRRGYRRTDILGRTGLEASHEQELRGVPGRRNIEVDARGREISVISEEAPQSGSALYLTIDREAQLALERALTRELRARGRAEGAAVALDPTNGEVIALVSVPGYDPGEFARGIEAASFAALSTDPRRPLFPRAISGTYPSGSTIKPIVAAAALDAGIITPDTTILSTGGIWHAKRWFFPDWKPGGHGPTTITRALAESVNTFFYTIGGGTATFEGLGPERIAEAANRFGLGRILGIDLPGEAPGIIPTPDWKQKKRQEAWFIGDTYHLAIGQGDVLVTPLQIAAATAAVANGGAVYRPHLSYASAAPDGKLVRVPATIVHTQAATGRSLEVVRRGMRQAVTSGSARSLNDLPVPVAGKTGTAEWNDAALPHAWFTGFAPYDRPRLVITVLLESSGGGDAVAVPVAREFLSWYFTHR